MEAIRGEGITSHPSLYTFGKEPRYPLDWRVYGPHSGLERFGEEQNVLYPSGFETWMVQPVALSLHRLRYSSFYVKIYAF
jgi:hypothetical protein